MGRTGKLSLAVVILLALVTVSPVVMADAAGGDVDVLFDHGNGSTEWTDARGDTLEDVIINAAGKVGIDCSFGTDGPVLDGLERRVIGGNIVSTWHVFVWDRGSWKVMSDLSADCSWSAVAIGFYPDGICPVVTPDDPVAMTMARGDATNSSSQTASFSSKDDYKVTWTQSGTAHATTLYAGGYLFQKYGIDKTGNARVVCLDADTGEERWSFRFISAANYESSTPLIVGDYIYVATLTGYIYRMPWSEGPGEDNVNVTSFSGASFGDAVPYPSFIKDFDVGTTYDAGFTSLVFDSGAIYASHSNGMVYCFDTDLNLIWSYLLDGSTYFMAPTVSDGMVFVGALNGYLYILDSADGSLIKSEKIYQVKYRNTLYGSVGQAAVIANGNDNYSLFFTVSDGLGMSQSSSGLAVYEYDRGSNTLVKRFLDDTLGEFGRYVTPVVTDGFRGAYAVCSDGIKSVLVRIDGSGSMEVMAEGLAEIHSPITVVNGEYLYMISYSSAEPIYKMDLDGNILAVAECPSDIRNFNMIPLLVLGDTVFGGTDSGIYRFDGSFIPYVPSDGGQGQPLVLTIAEVVGVIILILALIYCVLRFGRGIEKPFNYLKTRFLHYFYGEDYTHNTRSRHRLKFVLVIGVILTFLVFTLCICVGSTSVLSPVEAYSALFSAISKGGVGLDSLETTVFVSRLPRTVAALAVGIGLAVAGSIYQAIIRNPLVDPYIMGVSSGAGVAAIAVIAFDFTFFGLFSPHSVFLTAITAAIGGLIAFACTMLLAEKSGGSPTNYVLAGVVVGLAFSALQTIMLTMAGSKLSNALTWLYGSFAEVTWTQVGIILFLSVFLSLVPLVWAKELNLVLLGEDQARQMGLNVRVFNRGMLILASILTSVCVAFVGVIGFVGLVIPHLCRMILGSDHRMVLPASICFGGVMLMLADLLARTGYYGMELPVGAITTVIGIPVFAYLLIKRGRMYDG